MRLGEMAYKEYGPVFRVWLTVVPTVVVLAPEHLQVGTNTRDAVNENSASDSERSLATKLPCRQSLFKP
jgi:hypothetical protein